MVMFGYPFSGIFRQPTVLSLEKVVFNWRKVNQVLSSDTFSLDSLGLPKGSLIDDHRFPTPKLVGVVGGSMRDGVLSPPGNIGDAGRTRKWWLIGLNASIVLLLLAWIAFRRWRSLAQSAS